MLTSTGSVLEFVQFWARMYPRKELERDARLYLPYIRGGPLTPDAVRSLFAWKANPPLNPSQRRWMERECVGRLDEFNGLKPSTSPEDFLERWQSGGSIYRLFWLHVWKPSTFPVFDRFAFAAMSWITAGQARDLTGSKARVIQTYCQEYVPFFSSAQSFLSTEQGEFHEARSLDRALWSFGKFILQLSTA